MSLGKHGITAETPKSILMGAGAFYKGLAFSTNKWSGTCIGSTSGGGKVSISGEYTDIDLDGAHVLVKGLTVKQGGTASMEVNIAELNADSIKLATNFTKQASSGVTGYDLFTDKPNLAEGDYTENFGFVGKTADGSRDIIIIFENALCRSAVEIETKKRENTVLKVVMDAYADIDSDLDTIPVKIYYPSASA